MNIEILVDLKNTLNQMNKIILIYDTLCFNKQHEYSQNEVSTINAFKTLLERLIESNETNS